MNQENNKGMLTHAFIILFPPSLQGGYIVDGNIKPVFKHATFISKAIV